jgi:hypothetical protein
MISAVSSMRNLISDKKISAKKRESLAENPTPRRGSLFIVHDETEQSDSDFLSARNLGDDSFDASVAFTVINLKKDDSKSDFKKKIQALIKIQQKKLKGFTYGINKAKANIRYHRFLEPDRTSTRIFETMERIQSFEARRGKSTLVIELLKDILTDIKNHPTEGFESAASDYHEQVMDLVSTPAVRPVLASVHE